MKWNNIKNELPTPIPEWYTKTHDMAGELSCLVYGYDNINFYPRYEVIDINDLAQIKPGIDGNYILDGLILHYWYYIKRP